MGTINNSEEMAESMKKVVGKLEDLMESMPSFLKGIEDISAQTGSKPVSEATTALIESTTSLKSSIEDLVGDRGDSVSKTGSMHGAIKFVEMAAESM